MAQTYTRIASVEFALHGTQTRVTVSNLEYTYTPEFGEEMESSAVFAAMRFLRSQGVTTGKNVICITTSPKK